MKKFLSVVLPLVLVVGLLPAAFAFAVDEPQATPAPDTAAAPSEEAPANDNTGSDEAAPSSEDPAAGEDVPASDDPAVNGDDPAVGDTAQGDEAAAANDSSATGSDAAAVNGKTDPAASGKKQEAAAKTMATQSGKCGDNLNWSLDDNGVLSITGTGAMYDYSDTNPSEFTNLASSIKQVNIANGATSIGNYAFWKCDAMASVSIPGSVTSIGQAAFYACPALTSVEVPSSVSKIGSFAFSGCTKLASVTLPSTITDLDGFVFSKCTSLASIDIPSSVTTIHGFAFEGCSALKSVVLPDGVVSIGNSAFLDCSSLEKVVIPASVDDTKIEDVAFGKLAQGSKIYVATQKQFDLLNDNPLYISQGVTTVILGVQKPTAADGLVYNGKEQSGVSAGTGYTVDKGSATNAGSYTATATLASGYEWTDGTTDPATIPWAIAKAKYDMKGVTFADSTVKYDGKTHSLAVSGTLPQGVTVAYAGNEQTALGAHAVTASFSSEQITAGNYEPIADMSATLTIVPLGTVDKPAAATGLVYDGKEQTGVAAGTGYTVDKGSATNADSYTATATLASGYEWTDGSTDPVDVPWEIAKADYDMSGISFPDGSFPYDGKEHLLAINGSLPDGLTVEYANNGRTNVGSQDVTANFIVQDSANYNTPASKTAKLTITANNSNKGSDSATKSSSSTRTTSSTNSGSDKSSTTAKTGDSLLPFAAAGIALLAGGTLLVVARRRKA